ncbi:MAG: beta-lactamase family protein [Gammaproteobacteria bacterium]|nr:beta-lactamase family protein [Gammaproteobacteria bacterium]
MLSMNSSAYWMQAARLGFVTILMLCGTYVVQAQQETTRTIPLFFSSESSHTGVLRLINHSKTHGQVEVVGIDDEGMSVGPATVDLRSQSNVLIYASDLEDGNDFIDVGLGRGNGNWRLQLTSELDIEAIAYAEAPDGLLTSVLETVKGEAGCWRIPTFYSSDNFTRSQLRLSNLSDSSANIEISGRDDRGSVSAMPIQLQLEPSTTVTLNALDLEEGAASISGSLGDGQGNWQLAIESDQLLTVMNLLESERRITNLSTRPPYALGHCWLGTSLATADRSISKQLEGWVNEPWTPAIYGTIIDESGVRAVTALGVKNVDTNEPATVHDRLYVGSITKPMTALLVATLVHDESNILPNGWYTTVEEVFSDELTDIHADFHAVTLRDLLIHESGVQEDLAEWQDDDLTTTVERRRMAALATLATEPRAEIGKVYYSHAGYVVVAAMIEQITGSSWESLMQARVFAPLGMASAGFGQPALLKDANEPWGHKSTTSLPAVTWKPTTEDADAVLYPSAGVHVSMEDLGRFFQLWMNGKEPMLLDREKLQEMTRLGVDEDGRITLFTSGGTNSAGWWLYPRVFGHGEALNTPGSNGNWYAIAWIMRETSRAYFVATNSSLPGTISPSRTTLDRVLTPAVTRLAASPARSLPPQNDESAAN